LLQGSNEGHDPQHEAVPSVGIVVVEYTAAKTRVLPGRDRSKLCGSLSPWSADRAWIAGIVRIADRSYPDALG